jgi:hypothetical protein
VASFLKESYNGHHRVTIVKIGYIDFVSGGGRTSPAGMANSVGTVKNSVSTVMNSVPTVLKITFSTAR